MDKKILPAKYNIAILVFFIATLLLIFNNCGEGFNASTDQANTVGTLNLVYGSTKDGAAKVHKVVYKNVEGLAVVDGDMIVGSLSQINEGDSIQVNIAVSQNMAQSMNVMNKAQKLQAAKTEKVFQSVSGGTVFRLWDSGKVPYLLGNDFSEVEKIQIERAVSSFNEEMIENNINLEFVQKESADVAYVKFAGHEGDTCSASVGYNGGQALVLLGKNCFRKSIIQHEMMHTLGFWHEHNRSDRDDHIDFMPENLNPAKFNQYKKWPGLTSNTKYDVDSIMHYGSFDNSINNEAVLRTKSGKTFAASKSLSTLDIEGLRVVYGSVDEEINYNPMQLTDNSFIKSIVLERGRGAGDPRNFDDDKTNDTDYGNDDGGNRAQRNLEAAQKRAKEEKEAKERAAAEEEKAEVEKRSLNKNIAKDALASGKKVGELQKRIKAAKEQAAKAGPRSGAALQQDIRRLEVKLRQAEKERKLDMAALIERNKNTRESVNRANEIRKSQKKELDKIMASKDFNQIEKARLAINKERLNLEKRRAAGEAVSQNEIDALKSRETVLKDHVSNGRLDAQKEKNRQAREKEAKEKKEKEERKQRLLVEKERAAQQARQAQKDKELALLNLNRNGTQAAPGTPEHKAQLDEIKKEQAAGIKHDVMGRPIGLTPEKAREMAESQARESAAAARRTEQLRRAEDEARQRERNARNERERLAAQRERERAAAERERIRVAEARDHAQRERATAAREAEQRAAAARLAREAQQRADAEKQRQREALERLGRNSDSDRDQQRAQTNSKKAVISLKSSGSNFIEVKWSKVSYAQKYNIEVNGKYTTTKNGNDDRVRDYRKNGLVSGSNVKFGVIPIIAGKIRSDLKVEKTFTTPRSSSSSSNNTAKETKKIVNHNLWVAKGQQYIETGFKGKALMWDGGSSVCIVKAENMRGVKQLIPARMAQVRSKHKLKIAMRYCSGSGPVKQPFPVKQMPSNVGKLFKADGLPWKILNSSGSHCRMKSWTGIDKAKLVSKPNSIKGLDYGKWCN